MLWIGVIQTGRTLDRGPLVDTTNISSPVPLVGLPHLFVVRTLGPVVFHRMGLEKGGDGRLQLLKKRPKRDLDTLENEHFEPKKWRFGRLLGDF